MKCVRRGLLAVAACATAGSAFVALPASALDYKETAYFSDGVAKGDLPAISDRLPKTPSVVQFDGETKTYGKSGGDLKTLIGRAKDTRLMVVYGYARLVGYDENLALVPDIVEKVDIEDGRAFTFTLRAGHKWSDGHPFTTEAFRYWWEDVANNRKLSPSGPPVTMRIDGELPKVEIIDDLRVRYSWSKPNPYFLPRLAGAAPLFIYRPAQYLKKFHKKYADTTKMSRTEKIRLRNWAAVHNRLDNLYKFDNPDLPTLQPWRLRTKPPATRFIAERNPFYHRVDAKGHQLPYIDRVIMQHADVKLIPAKAGTGEADLQSRGLALSQVPFLKQNEARAGYRVLLWRTAKGSHFSLFPNLNHNDPIWRTLFRDVRFRRALSLAIDREAVNHALFFGMAGIGNNTMLDSSPLYREDYQKKWATFDLDQANDLLDGLGLDKRDSDGIRYLPDGRLLEIVVETAGEETEQSDILELIAGSWESVGIKLFTKPSQREVFRNRIFSGDTLMSVWSGFENGIATPIMSPAELAPTTQQSLQWPKWGQYFETSGKTGKAPDTPESIKLLALNSAWSNTQDVEERTRIWHEMLEIHRDNLFTIGVVTSIIQPIIVSNRTQNVPTEGIYNWDPGAHFGRYRPDTFWLK
jgi:peptide/nickel transport system substrate-binding protein